MEHKSELSVEGLGAINVGPDLTVTIVAEGQCVSVQITPTSAVHLADHLLAVAEEVHYAKFPNDPKPVPIVGSDGKVDIELRHPGHVH